MRTWPRVLRVPAGTTGTEAAGGAEGLPIETSAGRGLVGAQQAGEWPDAWSGPFSETT